MFAHPGAFPITPCKQQIKALVGKLSPFNFDPEYKRRHHKMAEDLKGRNGAIAFMDNLLDRFQEIFKPVENPNLPGPAAQRNVSVAWDKQ